MQCGRTVQTLGGCWESLALSGLLPNLLTLSLAFPYMSSLINLTI